MSLVAVEDAVQALLSGQISALSDPAEAWVRPPTFLFLTTPQIFVWAGDLTETRHTIPRLYGYKRVEHRLTVWLQMATSSDGSGTGSALAFPVLIDAVLATLRATSEPVPLTDSVTGATSVMQSIGETISVKHPPPMAAAQQSLILWHSATLTVSITEEIQA